MVLSAAGEDLLAALERRDSVVMPFSFAQLMLTLVSPSIPAGIGPTLNTCPVGAGGHAGRIVPADGPALLAALA